MLKNRISNVSKRRVASVSLILILTMSTLMMVLPFASGQSTMRSYAFIGAVPNPVGVGQEVLLHVGMLHALRTADEGWENITVTATKPDGETETYGPYKTDSTGGTGDVIFPDQVGTWKLQTHFPEQVYRGVTYLADDSDILELDVQADPVEYYPGHHLPSEYWTRPIDAQLREWWVLTGSWLAKPVNLYVPFNEGPRTAHILWTTPVGDTMGGLAGGDLWQQSYGTGDAYEGKWAGSIILNGVLFYNKIDGGFGADDREQYVVAVDLKTGEELWTKQFLDNRRIGFGQELYHSCMNYHGVFSYLWFTVGNTWHAYEPLTGDWRFTMENVPGGTNVYGPKGEILRYTVNVGEGWIRQWNSSTVVTYGKTGMASSWGSQVRGQTYDATRGFDWTVNLTKDGTEFSGGLPGSMLIAFPNERVIGGRITQTAVDLWGISVKPGEVGTLLFNNSWAAPAEWTAGNLTVSGFQAGWAAWDIVDKVGVMWAKENRVHYGFCLDTGEFLWQLNLKAT